jgi:hypothetical protein
VEENYSTKNGPTMLSQNRTEQNRRANTYTFYDSGGYDNTIEPYDINTDIDTILINTTRTKATIIPCECWNQISIKGCTIWRQIPTEDCTIILEGYPDDTVSELINGPHTPILQRAQLGYLLSYK